MGLAGYPPAGVGYWRRRGGCVIVQIGENTYAGTSGARPPEPASGHASPGLCTCAQCGAAGKRWLGKAGRMLSALAHSDGGRPGPDYGGLGTVEDIAYGVLYLASDESSFVTGSELVIDGGSTVQ